MQPCFESYIFADIFVAVDSLRPTKHGSREGQPKSIVYSWMIRHMSLTIFCEFFEWKSQRPFSQPSSSTNGQHILKSLSIICCNCPCTPCSWMFCYVMFCSHSLHVCFHFLSKLLYFLDATYEIPKLV